ncbi:MAG: VWA domain-containing protein, partial [Pseudomonadota bacterium]
HGGDGGALQADAAAASSVGGSAAGSPRRGRSGDRGLSRAGSPGLNDRIDPVTTLRAAAPWQTLRRTAQNADRPVIIHPNDIRLRRYEERSDRLLIFTVDASGSSAVARLAEAKGAIELMLAQAYAKRDLVALIAFRGAGAELLLPPTRSLVQAKRQLSALPGGGGTPLAAGLLAAADMAKHARGRGMTPTLVLLTDGRANVPLTDGAGRNAAMEDAQKTAGLLAATGTEAVLVDTSNRPADAARQLATNLNAKYFALPRADAHRISDAVQSALTG